MRIVFNNLGFWNIDQTERNSRSPRSMRETGTSDCYHTMLRAIHSSWDLRFEGIVHRKRRSVRIYHFIKNRHFFIQYFIFVKFGEKSRNGHLRQFGKKVKMSILANLMKKWECHLGQFGEKERMALYANLVEKWEWPFGSIWLKVRMAIYANLVKKWEWPFTPIWLKVRMAIYANLVKKWEWPFTPIWWKVRMVLWVNLVKKWEWQFALI